MNEIQKKGEKLIKTKKNLLETLHLCDLGSKTVVCRCLMIHENFLLSLSVDKRLNIQRLHLVLGIVQSLGLFFSFLGTLPFRGPIGSIAVSEEKLEEFVV